jgi:hypothetical protein
MVFPPIFATPTLATCSIEFGEAQRTTAGKPIVLAAAAVD